jgi:hypothetical protein
MQHKTKRKDAKEIRLNAINIVRYKQEDEMTTSNDLWRSCGCVNLLARLQRLYRSMLPDQSLGGVPCLPAWLPGWLISQQPSSAYLLSSTSSLTLVFFILELHTAFRSNQLLHFLTPSCLSSRYYIRRLLGRPRKSSLSSL